MRFGKESEPSLVASGQLFATGLSSDGRLTSAVHTTAFYGQPLVSWTPALGAEVYEVQWSKTQYPFTPQPTSTGTLGIMTSATSVVLPVTPGTWWYRVRGFDYSLPTGAQQMSWSDPAKLVVAAPKFKLVVTPTASKPAAIKTKAKAAASTNGLKTFSGLGFSMGVPSGWSHQTIKDSVASFVYVNAATRTNVVEVSSSGRGTRTMAFGRARHAPCRKGRPARRDTCRQGREARPGPVRRRRRRERLRVHLHLDGSTLRSRCVDVREDDRQPEADGVRADA